MRTLRKPAPPSIGLPSSAACAARASWPSISTKQKPLHLPVKMSWARSIERTVPNSSNSGAHVFFPGLGGQIAYE